MLEVCAAAPSPKVIKLHPKTKRSQTNDSDQSCVAELDRSNVQIALLSEAGGGVMRHVIDLYKGLSSRGWKTKLIVSPRRMDERYLPEVQSLDQEDMLYVDMERSPHFSDATAYYRVRSALKKMSGRKILHAHSTKAGLLGTLLSSDVDVTAYTPHAYRASDPNLAPLKRSALRAVEMAYSRPYDQIIAVSASERDYVLKCGVDPDRVTCIPNGIDLAGIDTDQIRTRRSRLPHTITLGFVGRLAYQKNPQLFIETLAYLVSRGYDVKAIVVGDGDLRDELMSLAEQLNVAGRIEWRGDIPARESMNEMDLMVHTSRYEALPYTLLEACASLLPSVATENHGSRSVLQGELSENIVSQSTPEELSNRILELVQDKPLWLHQLHLLEQAANAFSLDNMVTRVGRIYLNLLAEHIEFSRSTNRYMSHAVSRIQPFA
jgi:glycosyltransferase involved in cell wall biosynthesis